MVINILDLRSYQLPSFLNLPNVGSDKSVTRVFQLQQGESIQVRGVKEIETFLYINEGKIKAVNSKGEEKLLEKMLTQLDSLALSSEEWTISALEDTILYHVDGEKLDYLVSWDEIALTLKNEEETEDDYRQALAKALNSPTLRALPIASVYELIKHMKRQAVKEGDFIIKQGEKGEEFYIIDSGRAEVWQMGLYDDEPQKVATLRSGDSFGEDALVTGGTRNATIKMIKDGVLLVGDRTQFSELVAKPAIKEIEAEVAKVMLEQGYTLLDVRYEEEYEESHIEGCMLVPLHELRQRFEELDPAKKYVIYCRSGRRSAVAALILSNRGFNNILSLKGGITNWPYETKSLI